MRGLPPRSFLGTDATSWIIHHVNFVKSRAEAVEVGQVGRAVYCHKNEFNVDIMYIFVKVYQHCCVP